MYRKIPFYSFSPIIATKIQTGKYVATEYIRTLNDLKIYSKKYNVSIVISISK